MFLLLSQKPGLEDEKGEFVREGLTPEERLHSTSVTCVLPSLKPFREVLYLAWGCTAISEHKGSVLEQEQGGVHTIALPASQSHKMWGSAAGTWELSKKKNRPVQTSHLFSLANLPLRLCPSMRIVVIPHPYTPLQPVKRERGRDTNC